MMNKVYESKNTLSSILFSEAMASSSDCSGEEISSALTEEEKIEDFNYLYKIVEENYPFLEVNKRVHGVDWLANKEEHLGKVKETSNDHEFLMELKYILEQLNNRHTQIISDSDRYKFFREAYSRIDGWQEMNFHVLNNEKALARYKIEQGEDKTIINSNSNEKGNPIANASVKDVIEGKIGYIGILKMISPHQMDKDIELIDEYLNKIQQYQSLIIDIRGNGGGDSRYWSDYLVPKIIEKAYRSVFYRFWRGGDLINEFFWRSGETLNEHYYEVDSLDTTILPNLPPEILTDFEYYSKYFIKINPDNGSINFKGNIYLLVDNIVYSSAETFAAFAKSSRFATLIGERTGGDGIGNDPLFVMLHNSGYVFRFSKDMGLTEDGTCNEEHQTSPDYEIESPEKTGDFTTDNCIKKVLELEGLD